jgi:hypothetical protein
LLDCQSRGSGFESHQARHALVSQQAEEIASKAMKSQFESEGEYHTEALIGVIIRLENGDDCKRSWGFESTQLPPCPRTLRGLHESSHGYPSHGPYTDHG